VEKECRRIGGGSSLVEEAKIRKARLQKIWLGRGGDAEGKGHDLNREIKKTLGRSVKKGLKREKVQNQKSNCGIGIRAHAWISRGGEEESKGHNFKGTSPKKETIGENGRIIVG